MYHFWYGSQKFKHSKCKFFITKINRQTGILLWCQNCWASYLNLNYVPTKSMEASLFHFLVVASLIEELWHLCRLPAAGFTTQHYDIVIVDCLHDNLLFGQDGQRQAGHLLNQTAMPKQQKTATTIQSRT